MINLAILTIDKELVDYKLSDSIKELSDFNNSLVRAGYPFWFTEGCKVENIEVTDSAEAMNVLIKIPFAKKRSFETLTASAATPAKATLCWVCGYNVKNKFNFCPICGEKLEEN